MLITSGVGFSVLCVGIDGLALGGPVPSGAPGVVIDVIGSAQGIDSALPTGRKRTILVFVRIEVPHLSVVSVSSLSVGRRISGRGRVLHSRGRTPCGNGSRGCRRRVLDLWPGMFRFGRRSEVGSGHLNVRSWFCGSGLGGRMAGKGAVGGVEV